MLLLLLTLLLFLWFEDVVDDTCFDNNSATGRIDKESPVGNVGVVGVGGVRVMLLLVEEECGVANCCDAGNVDNGGGDECE